MANRSRFSQRGSWHFSDGGTKFDGRPKPTRRSKQKPISPALKRGVIHCSRCGSRVISNADYCPFCNRSLRPLFARFEIWLAIVIIVTISVVGLIAANLPKENTSPSGPATPGRPQVIGGYANSSLKNLSFGTAIDNNGLRVTVTTISLGPLAADGSQIYIVEAEFYNTRTEATLLYSTQWMLETSDGKRLDTFVGLATDGTTLSSNIEAYRDLPTQGRFSARLYFAVPRTVDGASNTGITPVAVLFMPSPISYNEEILVSWKVEDVTPEEQG